MDSTLVGVLGVLIGILLSNASTMFLEWRRRRERIKDAQTSLRAEMRSHWHQLAPGDLDERGNLIVARILEPGEAKSFTPFIPREDHTAIFVAVVNEIHILPNNVIDPVVLYYAHINAISRFVDDLRSERFAALEATRKVEMYRDFIEMKKRAYALASEAIETIDDSLRSGRTQ